MPLKKNSRKTGRNSFKVFYELMARKVREILLVSSPYEAFIMEEDGRLAERIIHEYKGLNLSSPPMITWASSANETLDLLKKKAFDLVIAMPHLSDMAPHMLCRKIKETYPELPVYFLAHDILETVTLLKSDYRAFINRIFVWRGNADLLLALIKNSEDIMNVSEDTKKAKVRVIIFVEDSPVYLSSLLSLLYKEVVLQTQSVMDESINEEQRILRMRARPKILIAENYEEAESLYRKFKPYLLCVLSDVRFQKNNVISNNAGYELLSMIRRDMPSIPLCMLSSEESNSERASNIQAFFFNKNSPSLHADIRYFLVRNLGFGDFVFRLPGGRVLARASNLRTLGSILPSVSEKSILYHAERNDFSTWLMARGEIELAYELKDVKVGDFKSETDVKHYLTSVIKRTLIERQEGRIADFIQDGFDPYAGFIKIGRGSLGGKARGLAFLLNRLKETTRLEGEYADIHIVVPKTTVISTEGFDAFMEENKFQDFRAEGKDDARIEEIFLNGRFPEWLARDLEQMLDRINYPLAIRSSSLMEDGYYRPCAGAYNTFMLPNNHPDIRVRLDQLIAAIKLVYASIFLQVPQTFAKTGMVRTEEDKMAVIIQKLAGNVYGDYFYPAVSGVAQSYNYYPIDYMKPEEGIAFISMGLGKSVVEGYSSIRFSPRYPEFIPQFSSVDAILDHSQKRFFALNMKSFPEVITTSDALQLAQLDIDDACDHEPVKIFSSTYYPDDHRIRDTFNSTGYPVMTFARLLKQSFLNLPEIIRELLDMGRTGMGCPVEMEFAIDLASDAKNKPEFQLLQIRPMTVQHDIHDVEISEKDLEQAFCRSGNAMGHGQIAEFHDIVFVKPDAFDPVKTINIAAEIGRINSMLEQKGYRYILAGPGRWGSADRFLGIPVTWKDISGVSCIIETTSTQLNAAPSQGTHFFHNITSLGITYLTVTQKGTDFIDWEWVQSRPVTFETAYIRYVSLKEPVILKVDGKTLRAVIIKNFKHGGPV
ncbi:MAG: phosphoenolpyruvate synthase/pyruvate phosphate dikinase [Proteobacteria bacterium]|nr:phosphoenolpyruvate synthase/pyruvate phosphate dikinase [Pseudomonadota bacterium]